MIKQNELSSISMQALVEMKRKLDEESAILGSELNARQYFAQERDKMFEEIEEIAKKFRFMGYMTKYISEEDKTRLTNLLKEVYVSFTTGQIINISTADEVFK